MDVVLPAPFTPATMITVGVCWPMTRGFSSGLSMVSSASASSHLTAAGDWARPVFTRSRRSFSSCVVASTPVSAISRASSSSSYSDSVICVPVKTVEMLEPVLRRPRLSLETQSLRSGAVPGTGSSMAGATRVPIRLPVWA